MRIGIDCRMWAETGIGRYIRNIVQELSKLDSNNEYVLFMLSKDIDQITFPANFRKVRADIMWHSFAEQIVLPFVFWREHLDLLHVPHFNAPILYPGRYVSTIHDLIILRVNTGRATTLPYPLYMLKRLAFMLNMYTTVHRAKALYVVSNYVMDDLAKTYGVAKTKMILTPNAVSNSFTRLSGDIAKKITGKYGVTGRFIFYVGNAHPHKNIERLLQAFELVVRSDSEIKLVLGGSSTFFYTRLAKEWSSSPIYKRILFPGYISDDDLPAFYSATELFVNPSLNEGFGIQLLEAFACGCKVACSNTTSLPEIGGKAAYYFDPTDVSSMAATITTALSNSDSTRISLGHEIVRSYSWSDSAGKVLAGYAAYTVK